jgi:5-methylcytosine-specific restriction protein A
MPTRSKRPCQHPGCIELVASGYCEKHKPIEIARKRTGYKIYNDTHRDKEVQKLYDRKWQTRRSQQLKDHPLCQDCLKYGRQTPAKEVHHEIVHKGNLVIFRTSPLLSLCKSCHSAHTKIEWSTGYYYPPRPIMVMFPIFMVCGAPASGKSTYVQKNQEEGDIVFDLDAIVSQITGQELYSGRTDDILDLAVRIRNLRLLQLEGLPYQGQRVWFIAGAPTSKERNIWKNILKPKGTYLVMTDTDTCIRRIQEDPRRASIAGEQILAVKKWWEKFEHLPDEEVVRMV